MATKWSYFAVKLLSDLLVINLSFLLAFFFSFGLSNILQIFQRYSQQILFLNILWVVIFNLAGLYKLRTDSSYGLEGLASVSFAVFSAAFFNYIIVVYVRPEAIYSKEIIVIGSIIAFFLTNFTRYIVWKRFHA